MEAMARELTNYNRANIEAERRIDVSLLALQHCGFEDDEGFQNGHARLEVAQSIC
jgi:hypothetical protein